MVDRPDFKPGDAALVPGFWGINNKNKRVCFDCRKVYKGGSSAGENTENCSLCGQRLVNTGTHWRFPRRHNLSGWKKLQDRYEAYLATNPEHPYRWFPTVLRTSPWRDTPAGSRNKPHLRA